MSASQIPLFIFIAIAAAGIFFLGWALYRLCLESRRSRHKHEKLSISSYAQPGYDFGEAPRTHPRRHLF